MSGLRPGQLTSEFLVSEEVTSPYSGRACARCCTEDQRQQSEPGARAWPVSLGGSNCYDSCGPDAYPFVIWEPEGCPGGQVPFRGSTGALHFCDAPRVGGSLRWYCTASVDSLLGSENPRWTCRFPFLYEVISPTGVGQLAMSSHEMQYEVGAKPCTPQPVLDDVHPRPYGGSSGIPGDVGKKVVRGRLLADPSGLAAPYRAPARRTDCRVNRQHEDSCLGPQGCWPTTRTTRARHRDRSFSRAGIRPTTEHRRDRRRN